MDKVFTKCVRTHGDLQANFVFENQEAVDAWINSDFQVLSTKHGGLTITITDLPGLAVGDKCNVMGEGWDEFTIVKLIAWDANRFGFLLDSGCVEEVAKCHTDCLSEEF